MRKALYIIGMFLLVQFGMSIVLVMATRWLHSLPSTNAASGIISTPTLELAVLIITNLLVIVFSVAICRKGWRAPLRWLKPFSNRSSAEIPDETGENGGAKPFFSVRRDFIVLALVGMLPMIFLVNLFNELINLPDIMSDTFYALSLSPLALGALALVGPIAEEFCFRYGIEGSLLESRRFSDGRRTMPVWAAVVVSAALFGLIHVNPAQIFGAFFFGLYFGALYAATGSLWPSLLCHILNNAIAVVLMRLCPQNYTLSDALDDNALLLMLGLASAIVLILVIRGMAIVRRKAARITPVPRREGD